MLTKHRTFNHHKNHLVTLYLLLLLKAQSRDYVLVGLTKNVILRMLQKRCVVMSAINQLNKILNAQAYIIQ